MTPRLFDPGADDVEALARIHASAFADAWSAASIRDLFAGPGVFAFISPDGFILARAAGGEAEILTLAVTPAARRQGIARALIHGPKLILADEPTGELDSLSSASAMDLLIEAQRSIGATLVVVTHDMAVAGRLDRIVRLKDGRLAKDQAVA